MTRGRPLRRRSMFTSGFAGSTSESYLSSRENGISSMDETLTFSAS